MKKKLMAWILSLIMVISLVPVSNVKATALDDVLLENGEETSVEVVIANEAETGFQTAYEIGDEITAPTAEMFTVSNKETGDAVADCSLKFEWFAANVVEGVPSMGEALAGKPDLSELTEATYYYLVVSVDEASKEQYTAENLELLVTVSEPAAEIEPEEVTIENKTENGFQTEYEVGDAISTPTKEQFVVKDSVAEVVENCELSFKWYNAVKEGENWTIGDLYSETTAPTTSELTETTCYFLVVNVASDEENFVAADPEGYAFLVTITKEADITVTITNKVAGGYETAYDACNTVIATPSIEQFDVAVSEGEIPENLEISLNWYKGDYSSTDLPEITSEDYIGANVPSVTEGDVTYTKEGTYTLVLKSETEGYVGEARFVVTVTKKAITDVISDLAIDVTSENEDKVLVEGVKLSVDLSSLESKYSAYKVKWTYEDAEDVLATNEPTEYVIKAADAGKVIKVTITSDFCTGEYTATTTTNVKKVRTVTILDEEPICMTWSGAAFVPEFTFDGMTEENKNLAKIYYATEEDGEYSEEPLTDVGTYFVKVFVPADEEYTMAESEVLTYTITWVKTGISLDDSFKPSKTYDKEAFENPVANQITLSETLAENGYTAEDVDFVWYEGGCDSITEDAEENVIEGTPVNAGTYTLVGVIDNKNRVVLGSYIINKANPAKFSDGRYQSPKSKLAGWCGTKVYELSFPKEGWHWDIPNLKAVISPATPVEELTVHGVYAPLEEDEQNYKTISNNYVITVKHKASIMTKYAEKAATSTAEGCILHYTCKNCKKHYEDAAGTYTMTAHSWILPVVPASITATMGKTLYFKDYIKGINAYSSASVDSKYANYIKVNSSAKSFKVSASFVADMPATIPVTVKMKSYDTVNHKSITKSYKINIKVKPDIKITKTEYQKVAYQYDFAYNFEGATKVQVRLSKGNTSEITKYFDTNICKADSKKNPKSYIRFTKDSLQSKYGTNGKATFKITVYYPKDKSITFSVTK